VSDKCLNCGAARGVQPFAVVPGGKATVPLCPACRGRVQGKAGGPQDQSAEGQFLDAFGVVAGLFRMLDGVVGARSWQKLSASHLNALQEVRDTLVALIADMTRQTIDEVRAAARERTSA